MTPREAFAWALGALVDGADNLPPSVLTVELMREAARLIASTGALPIRCDRAAQLFREMIAEEAAGAPFVITEEMIDAYHLEIDRITARGRRAA